MCRVVARSVLFAAALVGAGFDASAADASTADASAPDASAVPWLSGKFYVGDPESTSANSFPSIAFNGREFLVGWSASGYAPMVVTTFGSTISGTAQGYEALQRLAADGSFIGTAMIVDTVENTLAISDYRWHTPTGPSHTSASGFDFLHVYDEKMSGLNRVLGQLQGTHTSSVRLSDTGRPSAPLRLYGGSPGSPHADLVPSDSGWAALAWYADDWAFPSGIGTTTLSLRLVGGDGVTVTPAIVASFPRPFDHSPAAIDFDGTSYWVAWSENSAFRLDRVSTTGGVASVPVPTNWRLPPLTKSPKPGVRLAWNGTQHFVVWSDEADTMRASRIASDGSALDGDGIVLGNGSPMDLAASGTDFLLVYRPAIPGTAALDVRGMRIAADGSVLDSGGFDFGATTNASVCATASPGNWILTFDSLENGRTFVMARFVSTAAAPSAPSNPIPSPAILEDAGAYLGTGGTWGNAGTGGGAGMGGAGLGAGGRAGLGAGTGTGLASGASTKDLQRGYRSSCDSCAVRPTRSGDAFRVVLALAVFAGVALRRRYARVAPAGPC